MYADLSAYCLDRQATGWKVVVASVPAFNQAYGAETRRLAYNALIAGGWAGFADGFVDLGSDATIGVTSAELNATYFIDQVHLTAAGYAIFATLFDPVVIGL